MAKRNKDERGVRLALATTGIFSIFSMSLAFIWNGNPSSLVFLLLSLGVFIYSLFNRQIGFFLLLILRTTFDYLTGYELFRISSLTINFNFLLGLILIFLAGITVYENRLKLKELPLLRPWAYFLGLIFILLFFSFNRQASLVELFRLISFFSAFVLAYFTFDNSQRLTALAKAVIFSAIIPSSVAWWQLINRDGFYDGERWRLLGTFVHPNMLAFYLVFAITLTLFVVLNLKKGAVEKIPYALLSLFFVVPLLFTYTRAAWLALAFILFCLGVLRFRKLLLISFAAVFVMYFFLPFFQERVATLTTIGVADSSSWRLQLWTDMIAYIKLNPWFGYGPGTASLFIEKNIPRFLIATEPHNDYLKIWLESGVFALSAYLYLYLSYLNDLGRAFKNEGRGRLKMLVFFMILFTVGLGGASLTDNILKDAVLQWVFWAVSGGLLAIIDFSKIKKSRLKLSGSLSIF